jgi:ribosomal protein L35AE/L33A
MIFLFLIIWRPARAYARATCTSIRRSRTSQEPTKSGVQVSFFQLPTKEKAIEDVVIYCEDEVTGGMIRGAEERQHHIPALVAGK